MSRTPFYIKSVFVVLFLCFSIFQINSTVSKKVLINEFLALNSEGLKDEDGDNSDWIELYNPGETTVDLTGWYLTDDENDLHKWSFPSVSIGAGEYMVIFASGKDRKNEKSKLHTSFKLSGGGEYLALVESDSDVISYEYAPYFPAQQTDMSYGIYMNQNTYFKTPTPGAGNSMGTQVMSPVFSKPRGFYDTSFEVSLSVPDQNAIIYYTTDGTRPDAVKGIKYTSPVQIVTTTPLSAIAIIDGVSSPVVSNTYLFVKDIVNQPALPKGYPDRWGTLSLGLGNYPTGTRAPADYEMDPEICNNERYVGLMDDALLSLPSVSIVTNPGNIFSYSISPDTGGIYIYTGNVPYDELNINNGKGSTTLGENWERPASVEYFNPTDNKDFQINCGLRLHGGNSRLTFNSPKHSFTLSFRKEYGNSKLNYDLFDYKKSVEKFDDLILRASYNLSWFKIQGGYSTCTMAQYIIDPFARRTLLDMGQPAPHSKFVHLYLNGLYWGLYEIAEKINKDFAENYSGGDASEYDVFNDDINTSKWTKGWVDGDMASFNSLKNLYTQSNPYSSIVSGKLLNMSNFIDYMLMNYYIGNTDWDENNWFIYRNRVNPNEGFQFTCWDAETSMQNVNENKVAYIKGLPTKLFNNLLNNSDFKLLVADRIQKHFFNEGSLSASSSIKRYEKLAQSIDTALIGESARWGDYCKDVSLTDKTTKVPYNLFDHWFPTINEMKTSYLPKRSNIVFNQLKNAGLFSYIDAPVYNSLGGELNEPFDLTISANAGTIYYTTDGNDPRTSVSSVVSPYAKIYGSPLHVVGSGTVKARAKNGAEWSPLAEVTFTGKDTANFVTANPDINLNAGNIISDVYCLNSNIYYTIPDNGYVRIDIYSTDGRLVSTIQNGYLNAGQNKSEFMTAGGNRMYIYKINYSGQIVSGKLFVNK